MAANRCGKAPGGHGNYPASGASDSRVHVVQVMVCALILAAGSLAIPPYNPIELVERYRAYGLPEPPLTAKPVLCAGPSVDTFIGFEESDGTGKAIVRGLYPLDETDRRQVQVAVPNAERIQRINPDPSLWPTVAQLEAIGEHKLAHWYLQGVFRKNGWDVSDYSDPWAQLHACAWGYWRNRGIEYPSERPTCASMLKRMFIVDGRPLSTLELGFLADLSATVRPVPVHTTTGTYDDLLKQATSTHGLTFSDLKYGASSLSAADDLAGPIVKLWEAGFDAIPSMIRHLGDRRITRLGFGGPESRYHRVCDVAADVIEVCLKGDGDYYSCERWGSSMDRSGEASNDNRISRLRAEIPKLWNAARRYGERVHYLRQLKEYDVFEKGALNTVWTDGVRAFPLRVLEVKYPRDLLNFYRHVRFEAESEQIGEAVLTSKLPSGLKRDAFRRMAHGAAAVRKSANDLLRQSL